MEFADKGAKGADFEFEVWDKACVEVEEADKGMEGVTGSGNGPVSNGIVFRGGWAVAVGPEVVADPFDAIEEELAFLGVEGESPFGEDVADTFEVEEENAWGVAEEKDVVDDLAAAIVDELFGDFRHVEFGVFFFEKGLPFLAH